MQLFSSSKGGCFIDVHESDQDDLLNFEITEGDYADGTMNEDELLLSDEDYDDPRSLDDEPKVADSLPDEPHPEPAQEPELEDTKPDLTEEPSDTGQAEAAKQPTPPSQAAPKPHVNSQPHVMPPRQPYRQKFQRWPNQPPRWNQIPPGQQQMLFNRGPNQMRPGPMMQGGPPRQMRPGFPPRPFFNNNFMQSRPPIRQPPIRQRFFNPNQPNFGDHQGGPGFGPSPIVGGVNHAPALPRKVHINPNFKGGVEAAKNQLLKDQYFSSASALLPEDELLRKQQEFINHNMRQIERRRHERTPSPEYRRYSHSPSPSRYPRRRPFKNYDRKRDQGRNDGKGKDENQPEEDEETRAYRQQIESQRKKREEILRQKELRRKQQAEQKVKETLPTEPLQPIVVTDKKIVLKRKADTPEKSTTPPIKDAPATPTRRIVLKPSKESKAVSELKPVLGDGSKRKIQKLLNS